MGEQVMRSVLVRDPEGKTSLGKFKHKEKDNIKIDFNILVREPEGKTPLGKFKHK
jgi:hypothetical protein